MTPKKETLEDVVKEYLRLKKLGKLSVIPMQEGKRLRTECLTKMAKMAGYNDASMQSRSGNHRV